MTDRYILFTIAILMCLMGQNAAGAMLLVGAEVGIALGRKDIRNETLIE